MGYASAGYAIFNPVMRELIALNASDEIKTQMAARLIAALQEADWDTEDESLEEFADDPAIVLAFANAGFHLPINTVGDLLKRLRQYPDDTPVTGIDDMRIG
jgi:hypothetical protein